LKSQLKTDTVLLYDDKLEKVDLWGRPALSKRPNRRRSEAKPVKLFKLHLGNLKEHLRPKLIVEHKKAITDYLREIGNVSKSFNTLKNSKFRIQYNLYFLKLTNFFP
jgi:hypothetical protein